MTSAPILACAIAAALVPVGVNAAILVVSATGPIAARLHAGQVVPASLELRMANGDAATLLDDSGTRSLRGPGLFTAGRPATPERSHDAIALGDRKVPVAAAVRRIRPAEPLSLWAIDIGTGGDACYLDGAPLTLTRRETADAREVTVAGSGAAPAPVSFAAGVAEAPWPAAVPMSDGSAFTLAGGEPPIPLRLHRIAAPADMAALRATLRAKGCAAQLALIG